MFDPVISVMDRGIYKNPCCRHIGIRRKDDLGDLTRISAVPVNRSSFPGLTAQVFAVLDQRKHSFRYIAERVSALIDGYCLISVLSSRYVGTVEMKELFGSFSRD